MKEKPVKLANLDLSWRQLFLHLRSFCDGRFEIIFQDGRPTGIVAYYPAFCEFNRLVPSSYKTLLPFEERIYRIVKDCNKMGNNFYGRFFVKVRGGEVVNIDESSYLSIHFEPKRKLTTQK